MDKSEYFLMSVTEKQYNRQNAYYHYCRTHRVLQEWLNFLRTGYYHRSYGYILERVTNGSWWSTTAGCDVYGHYLDTYPTHVLPQLNYYRGFGFAIRCVVREGWKRVGSSKIS